MNVLHLPSASGITRGNIGRAVRCQWSVWWYHQRWPLVPPAGRGVRSILARTTTLSKTTILCCSLFRHEIKVKLCQKNKHTHTLSKQDQCVCVMPCNRVFSRQTALGSCETYSSPKPSCGNRFIFCLISTRTQSHANTWFLVSAHKEEKRTSHLVPRLRHFCENLEWHQLHSDKNGFGPGCWLSNTFWCCSTGRFIRSQIRRLTFTPKQISHTGRRQTELMHRITPMLSAAFVLFPSLQSTSLLLEGLRILGNKRWVGLV